MPLSWRSIIFKTIIKSTLTLEMIWNWYHQHARFFDWQHICYVWWTCFSTEWVPMSTNCAHLLADLFLYSYEADLIQGLLKKNEKKQARSFNFTFRYIDDDLSLNNSRFCDFVDRIYPIGFEIEDTTDTARSADIHLEIEWWAVKNETLRQKRWIQFFHCQTVLFCMLKLIWSLRLCIH